MKVYMDELPKGCNVCPCYSASHHYCNVLDDGLDVELLFSKGEYFKPDNCPIHQLVRCKDCSLGEKRRRKTGEEIIHCTYTNRTMDDADFCSNGRRGY